MGLAQVSKKYLCKNNQLNQRQLKNRFQEINYFHLPWFRRAEGLQGSSALPDVRLGAGAYPGIIV